MYKNVGAGHKRVTNILETILGEVEGYQVVSYTVTELFNDDTIKLVDKLWSYFLRQNWITLTDTLFKIKILVVNIEKIREVSMWRLLHGGQEEEKAIM